MSISDILTADYLGAMAERNRNSSYTLHEDFWRLMQHAGGQRELIAGLETRCDPAGDVAALALLRDQNAALHVKVAELEKCSEATDTMVGTIEQENTDLRDQVEQAEGQLRTAREDFAEELCRDYRTTASVDPDSTEVVMIEPFHLCALAKHLDAPTDGGKYDVE